MRWRKFTQTQTSRGFFCIFEFNDHQGVQIMQKQRFSRREFLLLAGATGGAALLAACQPVPPAASGSGEGTAVEPVTVAVQSGWCTGGDCDIWTPSIELFNEKYPHITIDMIRIGVNPEDTMTAVAGGTAPDIYHRYIGGFSELMARGVMLPLDDLIAGATDFDSDIYIGTQWHNGKWDFITYGIPVLEGGAMPAICWHKPHIAEFGGDPEVGPSSWMEMLEWPGCSTSTTLPTTRPKRVMIPKTHMVLR